MREISRRLGRTQRSCEPESGTQYLRRGIPHVLDELKIKTDIMRDQSAAIADGTDLEFSSTGFTVLIADLMGSILPTQLETSGLALLLCALVLIIVFKSFVYGLATLVVVVCGMVAELIFIFAKGWSLDIMTVMVAALVIGAGIDFGIHITHRFREEFHANGNGLEDALKNTVKNVGRALLAAAMADVKSMSETLTGYLFAGADDPKNVYKVGLGSVPFLLAFGDLMIGYLLITHAEIASAALKSGASDIDKPFYTGKIAAAEFFARNMLPELSGVRTRIEGIDLDVMELDEAAF
mgnify:CR=1 FL=1